MTLIKQLIQNLDKNDMKKVEFLLCVFCIKFLYVLHFCKVAIFKRQRSFLLMCVPLSNCLAKSNFLTSYIDEQQS